MIFNPQPGASAHLQMPDHGSGLLPNVGAQHGQRLIPVGKHSKGRQPKRVNGRHQKGCQGTGAFGGSPKKAAKLEFLASSNAEAKRIANDRAVKQAYRDWRARMTPDELALARKLKVHLPMGGGAEFKKAAGGEVQIEFLDPSDLPEASYERHPMEDIEPQSEFSRAIADLGSDEITAAADCFSAALTWSLDVSDQTDLVRLGRRALLMIHRLRPDLIPLGAAAVDARMLTGFDGDLEATGEIFGRVLEWIRRGDTVSAIGERLCLVAYVVRPTIMNSPTLEKLGEVMNKSRQAKDKLVQCLRDTFAGLKAAAMRGENTRLLCQEAHH